MAPVPDEYASGGIQAGSLPSAAARKMVSAVEQREGKQAGREQCGGAGLGNRFVGEDGSGKSRRRPAQEKGGGGPVGPSIDIRARGGRRVEKIELEVADRGRRALQIGIRKATRRHRRDALMCSHEVPSGGYVGIHAEKRDGERAEGFTGDKAIGNAAIQKKGIARSRIIASEIAVDGGGADGGVDLGAQGHGGDQFARIVKEREDAGVADSRGTEAAKGGDRATSTTGVDLRGRVRERDGIRPRRR